MFTKLPVPESSNSELCKPWSKPPNVLALLDKPDAFINFSEDSFDDSLDNLLNNLNLNLNTISEFGNEKLVKRKNSNSNTNL